jgi:hypothetical protein
MRCTFYKLLEKEKEMKTLVAYNDFENMARFFELEGDYSRLDDTIINDVLSPENLKEELYSLIYDDNGNEKKIEWLKQPTKDWDFFVSCGFYF